MFTAVKLIFTCCVWSPNANHQIYHFQSLYGVWTLNLCVQGTGSWIWTWIILETLEFFSCLTSVSGAESVPGSLSDDDMRRFAGAFLFFSGLHWNTVGTAFVLRRLLSVSCRKSSAVKWAEQTFFLSGLKSSLLILASQACKMFIKL